jgi:hypothetical protein
VVFTILLPFCYNQKWIDGRRKNYISKMSKMSLIKQHFTSNREREVRRQEREIQKIETMKRRRQEAEQQAKKACEQEFSEIDSLLRRDWFVEDDDIIDLVWDVYDDVFDRIMSSVDSYSERVRNVLLYTFNPPRLSKTQKARYISEDELEAHFITQKKALDAMVDEAWKIYKTTRGLSRPDGDVDNRYTELYDTLQTKKKAFEDEQKKGTKKYVPPSARGKVTPITPELEAIQKQISMLENEIAQAQKDIELEEQIWENVKKSELYEELLLSVREL